jgi:hypothetical protein
LIKKILLLAAVIGIAVWIRQSPYADLLTIDALKANADALKAYVADNYIVSVFAYLLIYILVAGLNIPGAVILGLGGGYLFGAAAGTLFAVTAATVGASLGFLMARYVMGSSLNKKYEKQRAECKRAYVYADTQAHTYIPVLSNKYIGRSDRPTPFDILLDQLSGDDPRRVRFCICREQAERGHFSERYFLVWYAVGICASGAFDAAPRGL